MRGSKADMRKSLESSEVVVCEADWGDMHVAFETFLKALDVGPLLKGLPGDRCQCPHWGYVLKGRMRIKNDVGEEVVNAGDAYYMAPGHAVVMESGTEVVEFSPIEEHRKTMTVVERNLASMQR